MTNDNIYDYIENDLIMFVDTVYLIFPDKLNFIMNAIIEEGKLFMLQYFVETLGCDITDEHIATARSYAYDDLTIIRYIVSLGYEPRDFKYECYKNAIESYNMTLIRYLVEHNCPFDEKDFILNCIEANSH